MRVEIIYPIKNARGLRRSDVIARARWLFLSAGFVCPMLNILTGGPAWSLVVLWSLRIIWTFAVSPDLVEFNRISQFVKFVADASILLILIDVLLAPGWAIAVVPIVCFGGLTVAGVLLFTDLERQKKNLMPILMLIIVSIVSSIAGMLIWKRESDWELIVMCASAVALLAAGLIVLENDFIREIKKRFHTE